MSRVRHAILCWCMRGGLPGLLLLPAALTALAARDPRVAGRSLDAREATWSGTGGQGEAGELPPALAPLRLLPDSLTQLGDDGLPAWFWPGLPGTTVTYRTELEIPRRLRLRGLLLGSAGIGVPTGDSLRLVLRNSQNTVLLDSSGLRLTGSAQQELVWLRRDLPLEGGERLRVDLTSLNPGRPPWITADDDCHEGNLSWIQVPALGAEFQPLDRDLNIRALGVWTDGDQQAPLLRLPQPLSINRNLSLLPLRVRARDESGLDSLWLEAPASPDWSLGLQRLGAATLDADWEEWSADLAPAGLLQPEDQVLNLRLHARDRLLNESQEPLTIPLVESFHWSSASGRADQVWRPDLPLTPGAALAQRVPLTRIKQEQNLSEAVVTGVRLRTRGTGELLVRLVADAGGRPARVDGRWQSLADSIRFTLSETCPEWSQAQFVNPLQDVEQGGQVWLLLDYSLPSQVTEAPAPQVEWLAPGGPPPDSLHFSWSWTPLENEWHPLPAGTMLVEALLEAESCDYAVPLTESFDEVLASVSCWSETHLPTSTGWLTSTDGQSESACFTPANGIYDPDDLTDGGFVFINSDAQGAAGIQADTLFTPWLRFNDGVGLSFNSCLGDSTAENGSVITRYWVGESEGAWTTLMSHNEISVSSDDGPCTDILHSLWTRSARTIATAGVAGRVQLAFVYAGHYGEGWAIDSVQVLGQSPDPSPWDGPQAAVAELGRIFPNPFNPETVIPFRLLRSGPARLEIFNLAGQRVDVLVDEPFRRAGQHQAVFRPRDLASGIYIVRLEAAGASDARRLVYLK